MADELSTPQDVNTSTKPNRKQPFGITAEPGSKQYHRLYTRAWLAEKREQRGVDSKQIAREVTQPRMGHHVTLSELSRQQGWPTDKLSQERLRKRLQARQKLVGVVLLFKLSTLPQGRLYTTVPLLRRYASELFDEPGEQADAIKALMAGVQQRQTELHVEIRKLLRRVRALEAGLAGRPASRPAPERAG